jgi:hypothetical protein
VDEEGVEPELEEEALEDDSPAGLLSELGLLSCELNLLWPEGER